MLESQSRALKTCRIAWFLTKTWAKMLAHWISA